MDLGAEMLLLNLHTAGSANRRCHGNCGRALTPRLTRLPFLRSSGSSGYG